MKMKNFDNEFKNLKDYILKITYRIWEERGVDRIRDYLEKRLQLRPQQASHTVLKM